MMSKGISLAHSPVSVADCLGEERHFRIAAMQEVLVCIQAFFQLISQTSK